MPHNCCYPNKPPLLPMLPLIPEHGTQSDSSSSIIIKPITSSRTLPYRKRHCNNTARKAKTLSRSRSVPLSSYLSRTPTPASTPSPSVSTQDEEDSGKATPTNEKISPPRPISLDLKNEVFMVKSISVKVDREAQTPQDSHPGLRFADESSSVIHAGITPPDDGSQMSASDFRVSSPTRACQESQLSMTSSTASTPKRHNYLYGRPFNTTQWAKSPLFLYFEDIFVRYLRFDPKVS